MTELRRNNSGALPGCGKTIFILTSHYPYPPGEQFLESEIPVWRQNFGGNIILMPAKAEGDSREVPAGVEVSLALSNAYSSRVDCLWAIVSSFFFSIFWKEIGFLRRMGKLAPGTFLRALKATTHVSITRMALARASRSYGNPDIIYTYWFGYQTFAASMCASGATIITRAHRGDLYEDRAPDCYMYLKRQFIRSIDRVYVISEDGLRYMKDIFHVESNVRLSRLGVEIPNSPSIPDVEGKLSIVSVSFCVPVKNIDRIIDAICLADKMLHDVKISWRHIGDGPLRSMLETYAQHSFTGTNIDWHFLGHMDNAAVLNYFETHAADVIINASSSEGIPVSIMEAMARGIPALAPSVGGVAELVSDDNGILLSADSSPEDIAAALVGGLRHLKSKAVRQAAIETVKKSFDRNENYKAFVEDVVALSDS